MDIEPVATVLLEHHLFEERLELSFSDSRQKCDFALLAIKLVLVSRQLSTPNSIVRFSEILVFL